MLSSSLKTGRRFCLRLTCFLLRVTARRFLISLVGLSQSIEVETLMKSGECSLAVLWGRLGRVGRVVIRNRDESDTVINPLT